MQLHQVRRPGPVFSPAVGDASVQDGVDRTTVSLCETVVRREALGLKEKSKACETVLRRVPGGVELYLAHLTDLDPKWPYDPKVPHHDLDDHAV